MAIHLEEGNLWMQTISISFKKLACVIFCHVGGDTTSFLSKNELHFLVNCFIFVYLEKIVSSKYDDQIIVYSKELLSLRECYIESAEEETRSFSRKCT